MVELSKSKKLIILAIAVSTLTILAASASVLMSTKDAPLPNRVPIARFTGPNAGYAGENLTFNASPSYDTDGHLASYNWDFGDGHVENITKAIVWHIFSTNGSFSISLIVVDDDGGPSRTESAEIEVLPEPPVLTPWLSPPNVWIAKDYTARIYVYASFKGDLQSPTINVSSSMNFMVNCKWAENSDQLGVLYRGKTSADSGNGICYYRFQAAAQGRSTLNFTFCYNDPITSSVFIVYKSIPVTVTAY